MPEPTPTHDTPALAEVEAVVLDVGGVLMLPHPDPIRDTLRRVGIDAPGDVDAFHRAHYIGGHAYDHGHDDPEVWDAYLDAYLRALGLSSREVDRARLDMLETFGPGRFLWSWRQEEAFLALQRLAAAGLALAIVSNSDGTVEQLLLEGGVCQVGPGPGVEVTIVVDSGVVGVKKPDPSIFTYALEALGVDADRAVYVGDTARNDVTGAQAAGLIPVQVDPYDLYTGDHLRVRSVLDVVELLLDRRAAPH